MDELYNKVIKNYKFKDSLYKESYERLKAVVNGSKSFYRTLFTEIYKDEIYLNEIFIRLVEETEGVIITSAKQIQELTEIKDITFKQIEETFIKAMSYRYSKALYDTLEAGGKYSDLLQIKPSYFNLPEKWIGLLPTDRYSSILCAINEVFLIREADLFITPDLRSIAQEIEAPYSVLMDCYNLTNKGKKYGSNGD